MTLSKVNKHNSEKTDRDTTISYRLKIENFLAENSKVMAELYGEEFADQSRWGPDVAAHLILAYINRNKGDKLWYKYTSTIKKVTDESDRKLIVCSCHTGFLSHTSRALAVAIKLRELGHEVVFVGDTETKPDEKGKPTQRKYVKLIIEAGFQVYNVPYMVGEDVLIANLQTKGGRADHYTVKMVEEEAGNMINVLRQIESEKKKPDIMLNDAGSLYLASIPAEVMDIPIVSQFNFLFTNYNRTILSFPENYPVRILLYKLGGDKLVRIFEKSRIPTVILKTLLMLWVVPYNLVRLKYMIKQKRFIRLKWNLYSQICGDTVFFPDYAAFGGMKICHKALPVGPLVWGGEGINPNLEMARNFKEFLERDENKPLIYVTIGTSGIKEVLEMILTGLQDRDYKIAVTTGGQLDNSELSKLPDNVCVIPLYPGGEICKKASLMINHGGSGSLNQAIQAKLPQICIPTTAEQQWNSEMVVKAGLGKQILLGNLSAKSLAEAVNELLQ